MKSRGAKRLRRTSIRILADILVGAHVTDLPLIPWIDQANWIQRNLSEQGLGVPNQPTLLVCSNILSEQGMVGIGHENIQSLIHHLPLKSLVLLLEPGDKEKTLALNKWRKKLLIDDPTLHIISPCGMEFERANFEQCGRCWNGRRESLHRPLLYQRFCDAASKISQHSYARWQEEYENKLLSWSYLCLVRNKEKPNAGSSLLQREDVIQTHYIGRYQKKEEQSYEPAVNDLDEAIADEKIKFCPIPIGQNFATLTFQRIKGFVLPPLQFGQSVQLAEYQRKESEYAREFICQATEVTLTNRQTPQPYFLPGYTPTTRRGIDAIANRLFGFSKMRDFQHQILARILTGHSVFGIAATGGGKSECYILPALLLPGVTVVISPLKSLMQDQYDRNRLAPLDFIKRSLALAAKGELVGFCVGQPLFWL